MNFTINRETFLENLTVVSRALNSKTVLPILTGIKIEAINNTLVLTACNTEVVISVEIRDKSLEVQQSGVIVYNGKQLLDIVRTQSAPQITMSLTDDKLVKLTCGQFSCNLILLEHNDFPDIDFLDTSNAITFSANLMKQIIRETIHAAAQIERNPILTGVKFSFKDGLLEVIATDSFRLTKKLVNVENLGNDFEVVIPNKTLDDLLKSIENYSGDLKIVMSTNHILFKYDSTIIQSRLLEGAYPDTSRLIPTEFIYSFRLNREDLIGAIDRVGILSTRDKVNNFNIIRFINENGNYCEIKGMNNEKGAAVEKVKIHNTEPMDQFRVAFSSKYILQALKSLTSDFVIFSFNSENKQFIIEGESDLNLTNLILPLKVEW